MQTNQTNIITLNEKKYSIKMEYDLVEGTLLVLNSNNELNIDAHFKLNIVNEQTFKFHLDKFIVFYKQKDDSNDLIISALIEFISFYISKKHKSLDKAPVVIIENATPLEDEIRLPILQFYPARDQIYISCYNSEVESEWLMSSSLVDDITIDTYRSFFRKTLIPKNYFLNEELLDTKISGIFLNQGNNYLFNHNDLFDSLTLLSPYAKNLHYKNLYFPHINMDVEHPNYLNAKVMNLKNLSKIKMSVSGHFFDFVNCNASKINISLDFLGESPAHSLIILEKFRYSQLKIYQHRHGHSRDKVKTPFIFLKNCKSCDIVTRPTTFFIIADTHKEKYENRSMIVDASADDLYHKIIYLTNNDIEIENSFKQNTPWAHMDNEEKLEVLKAFKDLLPVLEERYKLKFRNIEETILKVFADNEYLDLLNPKLMSQFLRNIRTMDSDHSIENLFHNSKKSVDKKL